MEDFEKPREKLKERGVDALSDRELIAILLGSGDTNSSVLELSSRLKKIINEKKHNVDLEDLLDHKGVGLAKACRVLAGIELSRRLFKNDGKVVKSAEDILPLVESIRDKDQEYFVCISLNGANEVIESRIVTKGLVNKTQVHPREVFAPVLKDRATSVIFAHNHPSGSLEISQKDHELTKKLSKASDLLGIKVLDHIVLSANNFRSIIDNEKY